MPAPTYTPQLDDSLIMFSWTLTTADHTGDPVAFAEWADRTWQFVGTWGGATATVEGSNTGADYLALNNAVSGVAADATANKILTSFESAKFVRPRLTTVGVGASVVVTLFARRSNPMRT